MFRTLYWNSTNQQGQSSIAYSFSSSNRIYLVNSINGYIVASMFGTGDGMNSVGHAFEPWHKVPTFELSRLMMEAIQKSRTFGDTGRSREVETPMADFRVHLEHVSSALTQLRGGRSRNHAAILPLHDMEANRELATG